MTRKSKNKHQSEGVGTEPESDEAEHGGRLPLSYPTMAACAGAVRIPMGLLKLAKRQGCSAFRNSRVYLLPLIEWVFSRDDSITDWTAHGKKFNALLAEVDYKERVGEVIEKSVIESGIREAVAMMFAEMDRKFLDEFPPVLVGKDEVQIRVTAQRTIEELKTSMRARFAALANEERQKNGSETEID